MSAAAAVGCSVQAVGQLLVRTGGLAPRTRPRSRLRLSVAEREEISRGLQVGASCRTIAARLARAPSTISREVAAAGGAARYRALLGRPALPKEPLDDRSQPRAARELGGLGRRARRTAAASTDQIAHRLVRDHPDDEEMRVSHETIYRSLFVQARGALRHELARCLRSGRARRRPHRRLDGRGELRDMVLIADRPAEAADRAVPGHSRGRPHPRTGRTLGDRHARRAHHAPDRAPRAARGPHRRARAHRAGPPHPYRCPLSCAARSPGDRGKEMAEHVRFSVESGVQVYFCDPHSPWQRATNENTNGLLRQYFPKGSDLSVHRQAQLDAVARELNGRPRRTLDWTTPAEAFAQVVR